MRRYLTAQEYEQLERTLKAADEHVQSFFAMLSGTTAKLIDGALAVDRAVAYLRLAVQEEKENHKRGRAVPAIR